MYTIFFVLIARSVTTDKMTKSSCQIVAEPGYYDSISHCICWAHPSLRALYCFHWIARRAKMATIEATKMVEVHHHLGSRLDRRAVWRHIEHWSHLTGIPIATWCRSACQASMVVTTCWWRLRVREYRHLILHFLSECAISSFSIVGLCMLCPSLI